VTLTIKNKEYQGQADVVVDDKEAVAKALQNFLRTVRFDARFYQVKFDENGDPNWEDVRRAAQRVAWIRVQLAGQVNELSLCCCLRFRLTRQLRLPLERYRTKGL
jgi:hypothetical protein